MTPLSNEQKKHYRSIAHNLKPVVTIASNGLNDGVLSELERALNDHELIKIKLAVEDRDSRTQLITQACETLNAINIQQIGKVVVLLRKAKQPNLKLSNIR